MHSCPDHDELLCHRTGERRENLLNKIKEILAKADDTPCVSGPPQNKPLIKFPGYLDKRHPCLHLSPATSPCQTATLATKYYQPKDGQHCGGCCLEEEQTPWSGEIDDACLKGHRYPTHVYGTTQCKTYPLKKGKDDFEMKGCTCSHKPDYNNSNH